MVEMRIDIKENSYFQYNGNYYLASKNFLWVSLKKLSVDKVKKELVFNLGSDFHSMKFKTLFFRYTLYPKSGELLLKRKSNLRGVLCSMGIHSFELKEMYSQESKTNVKILVCKNCGTIKTK